MANSRSARARRDDRAWALEDSIGWLALASAAAIAIAALHLHQLREALGRANPTGDHAIFEFNVRMMLEGVQRLGPYSQGFYHPGPAYFAWLALPYWVLRGSSFSLHAGAYLLTALFVWGQTFLVSRLEGRRFVIAVFVVLTALHLGYLGDYPLFDFWPPYVLFLGYSFFLILCSALMTGRPMLLPVTLVTGSFLVQTHVTYGIPVAVGTLAAGALGVLRARAERSSLKRPFLISAACLVVLWAFPVYGELVEGSGNLHKILYTFADSESQRTEWRSATLANRVALELTGVWQYLFFGDRFIVPEGPKHYTAARLLAVVQLWLLVAAFYRARRTKALFAEAMCVVSGVSLLVAPFALTQIRGHVAPHHTAWIASIGVLAALGTAGGFTSSEQSSVPAHVRDRRFAAMALAFGALAMLRPILVVRPTLVTPGIETLASAAVRWATEHGHKSAVGVHWRRNNGERGRPRAFDWAIGLLLNLEKQGLAITVADDAELRWVFGRSRFPTLSSTDPVLVVTAGTPEPPSGRKASCVRNGDNIFLAYPACLSVLRPQIE